MTQPFDIHLGDEVLMRKPHACGANRWTIIRTGIDIRIRCAQCGRTILLPRPRFMRAVRRILKPASDPGQQSDATGPPG